MESKKTKCKYNSNGICQISCFEIDGPHCNSCCSYEEKNKCSVCNSYITLGEEFYHKWDIGQIEGPICESCWNDETI